MTPSKRSPSEWALKEADMLIGPCDNYCYRLTIQKVEPRKCADCQKSINKVALALDKAVQDEREACCSIIFSQCGSDNVAQRTVDAIRNRQDGG